MNTSKLICWLLILIPGIAYGQGGMIPSDLLREANEYIHSAGALHLKMEYRWFQTYSSEEPIDSKTSLFLKKNNWQYSSIDGKTMIIEDDMVAMIVEEGKTVILQPFLPGYGPSFFSFPTDSLLQYYEEISLLKEENDSYTLSCSLKDPQYDRIEMEIDQVYKRISKVTLFLEDWGGEMPRMEITCAYLPFPSSSQFNRSFALAHVIQSPGPSASLTSMYHDYQLYNQFAQP